MRRRARSYASTVVRRGKLLDAAGVGDGFSVALHYTTAYGSAWQREAALIAQQLSEIGIELASTIDDFETTYSERTFPR